MGTTSEKLTYLNTTKTLIKEELNLGGANISTEPFRAYSSKLKGIYKDFLANGTDTLWNNWEKVNGTGETLSLSPTIKGKMKVDLKGNTYQEQTTQSANLFDKDRVDTGYLNADGTLYTSATGYRTSDYIPIQPNTAYYKTKTGSPRAKYYDSNKQVLDTSTYQDISIGAGEGTFTTPSNAYYLRVSVYPQTTSVDDVMIHKGSSAIPYVPFVPNSPSPDYPQDIQVVSGDNTIKVEGKNLLKIEDREGTSAGITYTIKDGIITFNGTATGSGALYIYIGKTFNRTETFSLVKEGTATGINNPMQWVRGGTTRYTYNSLFQSGDRLLQFYFTWASGATANNYVVKPMLEVGSTATTYTPYVSQTHPISLGNIELCKIGDYQDRIYKNNGKWYLNKQIGKVVLNGSENWSNMQTRADGTTHYFFLQAFTPQTSITTQTTTGELCDKLTQNNPYNVVGNHFWIYRIGTYSYLRIGFADETINTKELFLTWLGNNTPTIYYPLLTPTYTQITDTTLISQLEALAYSYEGTTNISQENDDMPFVLDITALKEMS